PNHSFDCTCRGSRTKGGGSAPVGRGGVGRLREQRPEASQFGFERLPLLAFPFGELLRLYGALALLIGPLGFLIGPLGFLIGPLALLLDALALLLDALALLLDEFILGRHLFARLGV